jgi:hypothetical protein
MTDLQQGGAPGSGAPLDVVPLDPSARTTSLAIRVWNPAYPRDAAPVGWKTEAPFVFMIADLVAANNGVPVEDSGIGMVAYFARTAEAFRTAKRIQRSLLEYSEVAPDQCVGAAIALYRPSDLSSSGHDKNDKGLVSLLERAQPAQILVTANAFKQLQGIPGLQLRPFGPATLGSSELERNTQELIWARPTTYARVLETLKSASETHARKKEEKLSPSEPTVDFGAATPARPAQLSLVHPDSTSPIQGSDNVLEELLEPEPDSRGSRTLWWSLATAGILAAAVAGFLVTRPSTRQADSKRAAEPAAIQTSPEVQQSSLPSPTPETPTAKAEPPTEAPAKTESAPTPDQETEVQNTRPATDSVERARSQTQKVTEYSGFRESDIPRLVRMAEDDAGAGKYEAARQKFEIVLRLDPANQAAKRGIYKLNLTEGEAR